MQIRTTTGEHELISNDVLSPGQYELIATFDNVSQRMKLFIDEHLLCEGRITGQLDLTSYPSKTIIFGHGGGYNIGLSRVFRDTSSEKSVHAYCLPSLSEIADWQQHSTGADRIFKLSENEKLVYCFVGRGLISALASKDRIEGRIVRAIGIIETPARATLRLKRLLLVQ